VKLNTAFYALLSIFTKRVQKSVPIISIFSSRYQ